jgi:hypothetical protein
VPTPEETPSTVLTHLALAVNELEAHFNDEPPEWPGLRVASTGPEGGAAVITKNLRYKAMVRIGQFGQPLSGEWARVRALVGDPGAEVWRIESLSARRLISHQFREQYLKH